MGKARDKSQLDKDRLVAAAAYFRSKNHTLETIGTILGCSAGQAFSLLKRAKARGLLMETPPQLVESQISSLLLAELGLLEYTDQLADKLREKSRDRKTGKIRFQNIYVVDSGTFSDNPEQIRLQIDQFGHEAAPHLLRLIQRSQIVGVAWGGTLAAAIRALPHTDAIPLERRYSNIVFAPTCGEPWGFASRSDSASFLAEELHRIVLGRTDFKLSLTGIPAVVPVEFRKEEKDFKLIQRFIEKAHSYHQIFGLWQGRHNDHVSLIERMDTVLTSVGTLENPWRMCGKELCESGGINRDLFKKVVLGDIGGVLIPKPHLNDEGWEDFNRITELWTGIQYCHYQEIAAKAGKSEAHGENQLASASAPKQSNHPGVVVLAMKKNKAQVALAAIESGLVNNIICDEELARALCTLCGARLPEDMRLARITDNDPTGERFHGMKIDELGSS